MAAVIAPPGARRPPGAATLSSPDSYDGCLGPRPLYAAPWGHPTYPQPVADPAGPLRRTGIIAGNFSDNLGAVRHTKTLADAELPISLQIRCLIPINKSRRGED